jgi:hypothetical protein
VVDGIAAAVARGRRGVDVDCTAAPVTFLAAVVVTVLVLVLVLVAVDDVAVVLVT